MPYIKQEHRTPLDPIVKQLRSTITKMKLDDPNINIEGCLNYFITKTLLEMYGIQYSTSYAQINDACGLLECIKMEFYRKVAGPYEDKKEFDSGPIVTFDDDDF